MFDFEKMGDAFAAMDRTAKTIDAMLAEQRVTNMLLAMQLAANDSDPALVSRDRAALAILSDVHDIANGPDART